MQKMKKSSTTPNQNEKYPNKEKPTQHEQPARLTQAVTHAGPTPAVDLARPTPTMGLASHRQ
jgi:hypothetical protein